ncbi:APC family permease [Flaviaesturariibacter aridisoli]|uniref:Amino acid permease n=1 Tax=Flaviaesturariibacter aridisoli TaxID=2545761 RepID=A0A4R4E6Y5_9BACT|nr:amino acid permease [Flaviaesturariibacter aridisoli]TCZ74560.1 amino acid permease [Flaviaesturariibacter aridisoli]
MAELLVEKPAAASTDKGFKRSLGLLDGTMIVAGSMIGSGIFIVSADMLKDLGSTGWLIAAWLITGFMTLTAALSYGELSAMFPKAGGQYVYLREAYNPFIGFLYGWSFFSVIQTGTIAAVGVAFGKFLGYLVPALGDGNVLLGSAEAGFKITAAQLVGIVLIVFLTYINTKGVKGGKLIQTTFTSAKLLALFGLIVFGFLAAKSDIWNMNWTDAWTIKRHASRIDGGASTDWTALTGVAALGAVAAAMVGSIFSSDAWNNVTFIAGEMKNPQRNIGLSLFLGTLIVTLIYVSANLMYVSVLPIGIHGEPAQGAANLAFAQDNRVALSVSNAVFGDIGTIILAVLIMVSTFGCNNGLILAGARVYYTMAKDGLFFRQTGELNRHAVPEYALWIQCAMACLLCLSGRYGELLDMVSFVVVLFYVLTIIGIFILRRKRPDAERPYKAFGYPVLPLLYILMGTAFCLLLLMFQKPYPYYGLGIVLIGIPIYFVALSRKKRIA